MLVKKQKKIKKSIDINKMLAYNHDIKTNRMLIKKVVRKLVRNLKGLRKKAKLTQKYVAEKTNVTETYISLLENGKRNPSDKMKRQLANLYNVKITDIFSAMELTKC